MVEKGGLERYGFLGKLGITDMNKGCYRNGEWVGNGKEYTSLNPNDNTETARIKMASLEDYESCMSAMESEKVRWAETPAPVRGEIVRQIGQALREKLEQLGSLITLEMGKTISEGIGEVQEFIDVCDMACGMSRTINGKMLPSERPGHVLIETWNPLGIIGVISAFNFPCAVFGWNSMIALICGDMVIWKGASSTSLVTLAVAKVAVDVLAKNGWKSVITVCQGSGAIVGEQMLNDSRLKLISFTGSTEIGKLASSKIHARLGKAILELGGNNAAIIMEDADLKLAMIASVFGNIGTAGQRCTTCRRLYIHESLYDKFVADLIKAYKSVKIGDPADSNVLLGPLHTKAAVQEYMDGLKEIKKQGGKILYGGEKYPGPGNHVLPTIVEIAPEADIVNTELFFCLLYVFKIKTLEEGITLNNAVPQGLSASLFTTNMKNVFKWIGPSGCDCGLVNVNCGTSGAEIGGAFGGEKETGEGRECGSDSWKQYMKRGTCSVNYSDDLPLAQGVEFKLE